MWINRYYSRLHRLVAGMAALENDFFSDLHQLQLDTKLAQKSYKNQHNTSCTLIQALKSVSW